MEIEKVRQNLDSNTFLSDELKENIWSQVLLFHQNFSDVSLDRLAVNLQTLEIEGVSPYVSDDSLKYQTGTNKIQVNKKSLEKSDNVDFEFMKILLDIIIDHSKDNKNLLSAFNDGMSTMIANNLVGGGELLTPEDSIVQIIGSLADKDQIMKAYFSGNPEILINELANRGIPIEIVVSFLEKINFDKKMRKQLKKSDYKSNIELLVENIGENISQDMINQITNFTITDSEMFDMPNIEFGNLSELSGVISKCLVNTEKAVIK